MPLSLKREPVNHMGAGWEMRGSTVLIQSTYFRFKIELIHYSAFLSRRFNLVMSHSAPTDNNSSQLWFSIEN